MIYILIVDDNDIRMKQTRDLLYELDIPVENITCVDSLIDAKRELARQKYDLLLLDIVLPNRKDDLPQKHGGIDLLTEIMLNELYKMPRWIFLISEFDEAILATERITFELSCTIIKYESNSDEWKTRFRSYVEQILRASSAGQKMYDIDAAIVCALAYPELAEVQRLPFDWKADNILGDSTDYFKGTFRGKKLVCAAAYEMGLSSAAILASKIAMTFHPHYLIMTGIAGGADKDTLNFGDVIIADPCFDYGNGKRVNLDGESVFKPDYRQVRLTDSILQAVHHLMAKKGSLQEIRENCPYSKPNTSLNIFVGPMASGAAVLSDKKAIDDVVKHSRKLLGFDMEAYAVMLSGALASEPKPIPIVIKSVSDFGEKKDDSYQNYAAYTSAQVMMHLLEELF